MAVKLLELFGGIGACSNALKRCGIEYELVDYVEIDKYAVKSYNAIYGTSFQLQDISDWDKDVEVDILMHGSPCTDFSLAGEQLGGDEGSGTRSSLMYETVRIVKKCKPKIVIWENVKNLLSPKHKHNFENYLNILSSLGYKNYYQILNAKDYGIPQTRERIFTVSILGFNDKEYIFPDKVPLTVKLKDFLEDEVDEKYFLSEKMLEYFETNSEKQKSLGNGFSITDENDVAKAIKTTTCHIMDDNYIRCVQCGNLNHYGNDQMNRVYSSDGISPTVMTKTGGGREIKIFVEPVNTMPDGTCRTIKRQYEKTSKANFERNTTFGATGVKTRTDVRKLTPLECWRLMGFSDEDFYKAQAVNSNAQLYKQAGNSIVVDVLVAIIKNLQPFLKENNDG